METPKSKVKTAAPQKLAVPFFARKVERAKLTVRAGVRAGARESAEK